MKIVINPKFFFALCMGMMLLLPASNSLAVAQDNTWLLKEGSILVQPLEIQGSVPGGPGFISLSSYAFKPVSVAVEYDYSGPYLINPSTTEDGGYIAHVDVPHGATINKLVMYFYDTSSLDLVVSLYRMNFAAQAVDTMAQVQSWVSTGLGAVSTTAIDFEHVDLQNYAYEVLVNIPRHDPVKAVYTYLLGVRIDYEYTSYLPTITK